MGIDSPTHDYMYADTKIAGIDSERPPSPSQPRGRDASRDASVVSTSFRTQTQSSDGDVHERRIPEPAAQSSEQQQDDTASQLPRTELRGLESALLRPEHAALPALPSSEMKRKSTETKSPRNKSPSLASVSSDVGQDIRPDSRGADEQVEQHTLDTGSRSKSFGVEKANEPRARASTPSLNPAWVKAEGSEYRHLVTGAIYHSRGDAPVSIGPTVEDIPEGWKAKLVERTSEQWTFEHIATRFTHADPRILPEATMEAFKVAASHGEVPGLCQANLEHDRIVYQYTCPGPEACDIPQCPVGWQMFRHPKLVETDIKAFLANYEAQSSRPTRATLLTSGGLQLPTTPDSDQLAENARVLLIEDIDMVWINYLCSTCESKFMPFFILGHLLFDTVHESGAVKDLVEQAKGWYWMSMEPTGVNNRSQYDVIHNEEGGRLHFVTPESLARHEWENLEVIRISTFSAASALDIVLMGGSRPHRKDRRKTIHLPPEMEIVLPEWWSTTVPTYLGPGGKMEPDLRQHLVRLLGDAAVYSTNMRWSRFIVIVKDQKWMNPFSIMVAFLIATCSWRDGAAFLQEEIEFFWERAIIGPSVDDFARLKGSRKYAENICRDLKNWLAEVEPLLEPNKYRDDARSLNDLKDLLTQVSGLKQETTDTFQLLIGAIAIRDSEIQKQLARESRIQARRSTALTALAAIYLPLSLTTGIFGMNISEISQGAPKYWAVLAMGFGLLVVTLPFLLWIFFDKDDEDENRDKRPTSDQRQDGRGSGSSVTANDAVREDDKFRGQQRDAGIVRRRTTMSSRMSRVATGELRPNVPARSSDMV